MFITRFALTILLSFSLTMIECSWAAEMQELTKMESIINESQAVSVNDEKVDKSKQKILKKLDRLIKREDRRPSNRTQVLSKMKKKIERTKKLEKKYLSKLLSSERRRKKFYKKFIEAENKYNYREFTELVKDRSNSLGNYYSNIEKSLEQKLQKTKSYKEYLINLKHSLDSNNQMETFFIVKSKAKKKSPSRAIARDVTATTIMWALIILTIFSGGILACLFFGVGIWSAVAGFFGAVWLYQAKKHKLYDISDRRVDYNADRKDDEIKDLVNEISEIEPEIEEAPEQIVISTEEVTVFNHSHVSTGTFRYQPHETTLNGSEEFKIRKVNKNGKEVIEYTYWSIAKKLRGESEKRPVILHEREGLLELTRGKKCSYWLKIVSGVGKYAYARCNKKFKRTIQFIR